MNKPTGTNRPPVMAAIHGIQSYPQQLWLSLWINLLMNRYMIDPIHFFPKDENFTVHRCGS
jgi:hypothetical protein